MNGRCPTTRASGAFFLLLLSLGAPPGKAQAQSGGDSTVIVAGPLGADLLAAAEAGQIDRIQELLGKGGDIESKDEHGRTPLMVASIAGRLPAVTLLLDKGSNLSGRNIHGADVFEFAVWGSANALARWPVHSASYRP